MSKVMQEIKMQLTGMRHAEYNPMVRVSVDSEPSEIIDHMEEYKIKVELGYTTRCYRGDKQRALETACESIRELIYHDFESRVRQIERAWIERDADAIESGLRDLFTMIGRD